MLNFQKDVIDRSHQIPVLVDFWAAWCGPCRVLGPVLEQLAKEQSGRWALVKVDTEEHPELAKQYEIMSIPNVKLFHKGKVINEFLGALPKFQLEKWLSENIPDPAANELATLSGAAWSPETEEKLRKYMQAHPDKKEAKLALAQHIVFKKPVEAVELVADIHVAEPLHDHAEDVRALARLMQFQLENGSAAGALLDKARQALEKEEREAAIQQIIEATMLDKNFLDELPRRSAVALFHLWGNEHELTKKYRRRFDMVLY